MAEFEPAFRRALDIEKGLNTHPADRGGITNFGISLRFLRECGLDLTGDGIVNDDDIRALTVWRAREIYREYFWKFDAIPDQGVADKLFDIYINMSPESAARVFQWALHGIGWAVKVDGVLGPKTLNALAASDPERLLAELRAQQAVHYCQQCCDYPKQRDFRLGWMRRSVS